MPARRFTHIKIDLVGPLPPSHGFTHLLIIVDRTTRWLRAVPLSSVMSSEVAWAFIATLVAGLAPHLTSLTGAPVQIGALERSHRGPSSQTPPHHHLPPTPQWAVWVVVLLQVTGDFVPNTTTP